MFINWRFVAAAALGVLIGIACSERLTTRLTAADTRFSHLQVLEGSCAMDETQIVKGPTGIRAIPVGATVGLRFLDSRNGNVWCIDESKAVFKGQLKLDLITENAK